MTVTATTLVAIPDSLDVRALVGDILTAAVRATKSDPGDRTDIARYERLCTALERLAANHAAANSTPTMPLAAPPLGPHLPVVGPNLTDPLGRGLLELLPPAAAEQTRTWLNSGYFVVAVTTAHAPGNTPHPPGRLGPTAVADTWLAPVGVDGAAAVEARFRDQVTAAVTPARSGSDMLTRTVINPSGVHNRVITNVLREHAAGASRIDVHVAYDDGSAASQAFPLHALDMVDHPPAITHIELRMALLSIRHTEMDTVVDGAWLRNAEVSRPRPRAETDDFVYTTSLAQLTALTGHGQRTATLYLYQTGLDAAIVGFYRSVTTHLLTFPGTLTVIPMFAEVARHSGTTTFRPGRPWCTRTPA
ncbi:hypothetical protein [Arthrobacter sp. TE12232]